MKLVLNLLKYYLVAFFIAVIAIFAAEKLLAQEKPTFGGEVNDQGVQPKVVIEEQFPHQGGGAWDQGRDGHWRDEHDDYGGEYVDRYSNESFCDRWRHNYREYRRCLRRNNNPWEQPSFGNRRAVTCELRFVDNRRGSFVTIKETKRGPFAEWEARNIVYQQCLEESQQRRISPFFNCIVNRISCY